MKYVFFLILIQTYFCESIIAQEWTYPFSHFTKVNGLPSNTIYCITSDHEGYLWLGTDAGVVRFDGYNMKIFNTANGLPSNDVFEIFCDSKNRLWLTTFKSDLTFIEKNVIHTKLNDELLRSIDAKHPFPRIFEDSRNNLWIRTVPFSLKCINKDNNVIQFSDNFGIKAGCNITELKNKLYFICSDFVVRYDLGTKDFQRLDAKNYKMTDGLTLYEDRCFYIDSNNALAVCDTSVFTRGEFVSRSLNWTIPRVDSNIWLLSKRGFKVYNLYKMGRPLSVLDKYPVSFFHVDKYKNVWIATLNYGLLKLNSLKIKNYLFPNPTNSLYIDRFRNVIIGTTTADLYKTDVCFKKNIDSVILNINSLTSVRILKIFERQGIYYIVTDKGIWQYSNNSASKIQVHHAAIKNLIIKHDSLILLDNDGIRFYNSRTYKPIDSIINYKRNYSYCEYRGKKLVGSQDSLYYLGNHRFIPYPLNKTFNYRPVDLQVKDSLLLATTAEGGVFFIKDSEIVKNLNVSNGFSSNTCYRSVLDKELLFTATNNGINVYDFTTDSVYHVFESDGLPSNSVFDLSVLNDTLYAATENGLSVIPVSAIAHFKSFPLFVQPVVINADTVWSDQLNYEFHTDQQMTIVMNALSFGTKSPARFYYKIWNRDSVYRFTQDQQLMLNGLPLGKHDLEIYAVNSEGTRSNTLLLSLTVIPYFYQTLYFKLLMVMVALICFGLIIWQVIRHTRALEKRKNELENKIRSLEIRAWKSAINPHFLFNSLNTAQALFRINDFRRANDYLTEFSAMMRRTLDQSGRLVIPVSDEVAYLQNYLELERIKRNNQFRYNITVSDDIVYTYYIPSLVIQPIIENALKHGIRDRENGLVEIHFQLKDQVIECRISDNGVGFPSELPGRREGSRGLGLIWSKIGIVEKLLKKSVRFSYANRTNERGDVIGTESIFIFPFITFDYDLSQYHYR